MKIEFLFSSAIVALSIAYSLADCVQSEEPALKAVSAAASNFTNYFYQNLAKKRDGNLACSPLSVDLVLSTISFGARGNTNKQLQSCLNLFYDKCYVKQGFQQLIKSLNNVQEVELKLANKIFITNGASLETEFQESTRTFFEFELQSVDFTHANETAEIINNYCAEKTNNRISNLFEPNEIEGAKMVLVNVVYFNGKWASKFYSEYTKSLPFHIDNKTTKYVPMMYKIGNFNWGYISNLKARFIELPYESKNESDAMSMFIILPDESTVLSDVENNFHKLNLTELKGLKTEVSFRLPKFKIESKLDLKPVLQNMGITKIFEETADLSGIAENVNLKVNKIVQKVIIEAREEGFEVDTDIEVVYMSTPPTLIVDRPFLCAIMKKSTGTLLSVARVIDPTLSS